MGAAATAVHVGATSAIPTAQIAQVAGPAGGGGYAMPGTAPMAGGYTAPVAGG